MVKTTRFMFAFLFAFVFVIGLGSASLSVNSPSFTSPSVQETLTITNSNSSLNFTFDSPISFTINGPTGLISFVAEGQTNLNGSGSINWVVKNTTNIPYSSFKLGTGYSNRFNITGTKYINNSIATEIVSQEVLVTLGSTYCKYGELGSDINILDIEDRSSGDEWEWEPLKNIKVRVEVENNADSKKSVTVQLGLYDLDSNKLVELSLDEKELEQTIRIEDDDDETYEFEFTLPADVKRDGNYNLYVKAFEKGNEDEQCESDFESIEIDTDKEVIADEIEVPSILVCGETNMVSLRVYNLDLGDEELMRVNLYSQELGLNLFSDQFELDEGDNEYVYFNFLVPAEIEAKTYKITFYAEFEYRESSDTYRDSESLSVYTVKVDGDKCKAKASPTITATLDSETETKVGEDLVVRITISNPSDTNSFLVALSGYESWASSATLDVASFNLNKDGTKIVTATFKPEEAGTKEFTIQTIYGGKVVEQKVTVDIEESSNWLSKMRASLNGNLTFWLTIAIFLVLILIVIVLLVRFTSSKRSE